MRRFGCLALLLAVLGGCTPVLLRGPAEGTRAPLTEGVDADGVAVDLNEHKGKVVLLSFWYSQCPPCRKLFAHEKELVKRYADRPFALVGVNADESRDDARACQQKYGLTWRSYWDGAGGPIAAAWKVDRFPALFLIDRQGVVRWRHVGIPPEGVLEAKIEELLGKPQTLTARR